MKKNLEKSIQLTSKRDTLNIVGTNFRIKMFSITKYWYICNAAKKKSLFEVKQETRLYDLEKLFLRHT